jgi:flagellar motility protein MotE (MotC chaperone)
LREQDAQEKARLERLVLLYQTMKPAEAANVLNGMDTPLVVDIFLLMRERNAAPILANMDPQKAREVTDALANRTVGTGAGG